MACVEAADRLVEFDVDVLAVEAGDGGGCAVEVVGAGVAVELDAVADLEAEERVGGLDRVEGV